MSRVPFTRFLILTSSEIRAGRSSSKARVVSADMSYEFLQQSITRILPSGNQPGIGTPPSAIAADPHLHAVFAGIHQLSRHSHSLILRRSSSGSTAIPAATPASKSLCVAVSPRGSGSSKHPVVNAIVRAPRCPSLSPLMCGGQLTSFLKTSPMR